MNTRAMNRKYFDARINRLNDITGLNYEVEMGSAYTSYKITTNNGSKVVIYCKTRAELDAVISGMIELAWAMKDK